MLCRGTRSVNEFVRISRFSLQSELPYRSPTIWVICGRIDTLSGVVNVAPGCRLTGSKTLGARSTAPQKKTRINAQANMFFVVYSIG